ncbi:MAG: Y-family DNA polymerase [Kiritimatiellae bacterium]|nr:Y-family DNA polymerase [Kiritimatiellia bacterium]
MIGLVDGNNFFVSCERVFDRRLVGRPVAVLSNNDGCCVSRSNEFKALGIPMGTPYFQLKDREAAGELFFRSSNYELYGDMSRRIISILRDEAVDVEQYSIDEAFIFPPTTAAADYAIYGRRLRAKILRWVGIPCGIGFAPTKTLAKIANHIGKKLPDGVFLMLDDPTEILSALPVQEVWGVGRRLPAKLHAVRIITAQQLRDAADDTIRSVGGVTLLRTAMELRGIQCHEGLDYDADPDSISCSRSFGEPATTAEALAESIAAYTAQAAAKLRRHGLLASGCNIYAQVFAPCGGGDFIGRTVVFPAPTDATNEMLRAIREEVGALYVSGTRYRKTGIVFFGLEKPGTAHQTDLFDAMPSSEKSRLYAAVDALNARYGKGKVFSAAQGLGARSWHMKRRKLSRRPTTRWDELMTVR